MSVPIDPLATAVALIAGLLAGTAFFAGLYFTTNRLARAARPGLLMVSSFVLRGALIIGVAWLVAETAAHWGLLAYLVGVTLARVAAVGVVHRADRTEDA